MQESEVEYDKPQFKYMSKRVSLRDVANILRFAVDIQMMENESWVNTIRSLIYKGSLPNRAIRPVT